MAKKTEKVRAQKRARQQMKKRAKEKQRQKTQVKGHSFSENAVQHQMLSEFGNVENFVRNIGALADMMREDEDLRTLRYDPEQLYQQFDLAADREALADLYSKPEEFTYYGEDFQDFWRDKRREVLKEFVTDEVVERASKIFNKLLLTKKGQKKEYRAVMAGNLLVQSHQAALSPTDAPLEDNNLWELVLLATLKENPKELPDPAPAEETAEQPESGESEITTEAIPGEDTPIGDAESVEE